MNSEKYSKADVRYRVGSGHLRCKNCTRWREGMCTAVAGEIAANDVCDLFESR